MTKSKLVDIMLMSASVGESLVEKKIFKNSPVTPAIRMNDTSDIWLMRNSNYRSTNPRPFRSARIERVSKLVDLDQLIYSLFQFLQIEMDVDW